MSIHVNLNKYVNLNKGEVHYTRNNSNTQKMSMGVYYDVPPFSSDLIRRQVTLSRLLESKPKELPKLLL